MNKKEEETKSSPDKPKVTKEEQKLFNMTYQADKILCNPSSPDVYKFVYDIPRETFTNTNFSHSSSAFKPKAQYKESYLSQFISQSQFNQVYGLPDGRYYSPTSIIPVKICNKQSHIKTEAFEDDNTKNLIYRSDVLQKGWFRNAYAGIILPHAKDATKGAKKADKFYKKLLEMLKMDVIDFVNRTLEFQAKLIGPLAKHILRKEFESKTNACSYFDQELKQLIIVEAEAFKSKMQNFSFVPQREIGFKHPIFSLAKRLMEKNEIYANKFWKRFEGRRDSNGSLETFKRLVRREMSEIMDLDDKQTFAHFLL